jgi:hypothetical protein
LPSGVSSVDERSQFDEPIICSRALIAVLIASSDERISSNISMRLTGSCRSRTYSSGCVRLARERGVPEYDICDVISVGTAPLLSGATTAVAVAK